MKTIKTIFYQKENFKTHPNPKETEKIANIWLWTSTSISFNRFDNWQTKKTIANKSKNRTNKQTKQKIIHLTNNRHRRN